MNFREELIKLSESEDSPKLDKVKTRLMECAQSGDREAILGTNFIDQKVIRFLRKEGFGVSEDIDINTGSNRLIVKW